MGIAATPCVLGIVFPRFSPWSLGCALDACWANLMFGPAGRACFIVPVFGYLGACWTLACVSTSFVCLGSAFALNDATFLLGYFGCTVVALGGLGMVTWGANR